MGCACHDREALVHRLSELLTVAALNVEPLREEMILLSLAAGAHLILDDIDTAVREATLLYPQLREALSCHRG